jgi:small subunit ribosomal protein S14
MPNARVLRDMKARNVVRVTEVVRRAYLYVARNQTLPAQVRHQAQLQLNTFGKYTRPTTVKNRCVESGRGRGIIGEFGLSRVRHGHNHAKRWHTHARFLQQFQFRLKALQNEIPGVKKASW